MLTFLLSASSAYHHFKLPVGFQGSYHYHRQHCITEPCQYMLWHRTFFTIGALRIQIRPNINIVFDRRNRKPRTEIVSQN